jgi:hypothetical protein
VCFLFYRLCAFYFTGCGLFIVQVVGFLLYRLWAFCQENFEVEVDDGCMGERGG